MTLNRSFFLLTTAFLLMCTTAIALGIGLASRGGSTKAYTIGSGQKGKRIRLWRAQEATTRVQTSTTVVLLAFGHVAVGGGIRFTIGPLPYDLWNSPLPAPVQQSIWQPRMG